MEFRDSSLSGTGFCFGVLGLFGLEVEGPGRQIEIGV